MDDKNNKTLYFRIDRVSKVVPYMEDTGKRVDIKRFDESRHRRHNLYMCPGIEKTLKFEFKGPSLQAIIDKIPTTKKVGNHYEATVMDGNGLIMFLLSQGDWIKVLEPQSIVDKMREKIENMNGYYGGNL